MYQRILVGVDGSAASQRGLDEAVRLAAEAELVETVGRSIGEVLADEVVRWRADLVVLGTHGRRGLRRMVLGCNAESVVRTSPVPVLLVRAPA